MKRTLFNTMMGCLAVLSLAGCGGSGGSEGSGGGSSEAPVSLIGEGFNKVRFDCIQNSDDPNAYSLVLLEEGQYCLLYIRRGDVLIKHTGKGTWSAEYQGNGNFKIDLKNIEFSDAAPCTVNVASSLVVYIPDMKTYQSGGEVSGASFTSTPFTHASHPDFGCKCATQDASVNLTSVQQE